MPSGTWPRLGTRPRVEHYQRLSIRRLDKDGALQPGRVSYVPHRFKGAYLDAEEWVSASIGALIDATIHNTPPGLDTHMEITLAADGAALIVRYAVMTGRLLRREEEERLPVVRVENNLGISVPWFVCSGPVVGEKCGRHAADLYASLDGEPFLCRQCHRLRYFSQLLNPEERLQRGATEIYFDLSPGPLLSRSPTRPKGMHQRTFAALVERATAAEQEAKRLYRERQERRTARLQRETAAAA